MPNLEFKTPNRMSYRFQIVTLASLYVAAGWIGVNLDFYHKNVSLI